jgi:hypothetical protein
LNGKPAKCQGVNMDAWAGEPFWVRLGVRVESSEDARQLHWLLERFDAGRIRYVARCLRLRDAPRPARIARELGAQIPQGTTAGPV